MCCHPENPMNELSKGDSHYECNVVNIVSCKNNDMIQNDFSCGCRRYTDETLLMKPQRGSKCYFDVTKNILFTTSTYMLYNNITKFSLEIQQLLLFIQIMKWTKIIFRGKLDFV